jgi:hypothetical protein
VSSGFLFFHGKGCSGHHRSFWSKSVRDSAMFVGGGCGGVHVFAECYLETKVMFISFYRLYNLNVGV